MNKTIVAVYADSKNWMAVELRRQRQAAEVMRWFDAPLGSSELTAELIREKWREKHFSTNKVVYLLAPEWVSSRLLQFPQLPPEQLEAAVRLELESKNIYYKILEVKNLAQGTEVRIAFIEIAVVQRYIAPLEAAGLEIRWLGWLFQGLGGFLNFHSEYFDRDLPRLCLYGNDSTIEFEIFDEEKLLYRRDFGFGLTELEAQPAAFARELVEELRLSLVAAESLFGNLSEKLWIFGRWPADVRELEHLMAELNLKLTLPHRTRLDGVRIDEATPRLAALLGIGLDELGWGIQETWRLQTKSQVTRELSRHRLINGIKAGAIVIAIGSGVALGFMARTLKDTKDQRWITERSRQLEHLEALNRETQENLKKMATLQNWLKGRGVELEFLRELQEHLPEGTLIEDLMLEDGRLRSLSGQTPSVSLLLKNFQAVPALKGLKLKGAITVLQNGNEQFQLEGSGNIKERMP